MTARREAFEEIGLPLEDDKLPTGYSIEHLTELPANLAMTELGVRPCVAYLKTPEATEKNKRPDVARDILPKLDAREVAAVFTAPFHNFLKEKDVDLETRRQVPGEWYKGSWHTWQETAWRMHQFHVPVTPATVFLARTPTRYTDPRPSSSPPSTKEDAGKGSEAPARPASSTLQPPLPKRFYANAPDALQQPRYRVFGMTARILADCARVAYGEEPEYEHNSNFGDGMSIRYGKSTSRSTLTSYLSEHMIARLLKIGRLSPVKKDGDILTRDVMVEAAKAKM
jgi:8-oxo-dGTP pyrophosphatase MutT (NUDIX family)